MREASSPSWFNPVEAQRVVRHIQSLQRLPASAGFKLEDVGVIAPYARQRAKIRKALELNGITGVRVGTTEEYQGESRRRLTVLQCAKPDYAAEAKHLLERIRAIQA